MYGRWEAAYNGAKTAKVPDVLAVALTTDPATAEFFEKSETRACRIEKYLAMLAKGESCTRSPEAQPGSTPGARRACGPGRSHQMPH